ncbi:hypothetical protein HDU97_003183 [Phlyctochytrium planicorne]|nr:hypothetical protein HDU97_003183 [Phlyctochytrium planicorne]
MQRLAGIHRIEGPKDHVANPQHLASLALTLMKSEAWDVLTTLSSMYVQERVEMLGSSSNTGLPLFCWNKKSAADDSSTRNETTAEERLMKLDELIDQWDPKGCGMQTFYRVWDEESVYAGVKFNVGNGRGGPISPPPSPEASDSLRRKKEVSGGLVILLKSGADTWAYHDLQVIRDWDAEFKESWHETLALAHDNFEVLKKDPSHNLTDTEDLEYWSKYDSVNVNGVCEGSKERENDKSDEVEEGEDTDDYWDSYQLPSY